MTSTIREEIKKIIYFIVYLILEVSIFFIITKTLGGISIPNFRTAFLVIIDACLNFYRKLCYYPII